MNRIQIKCAVDNLPSKNIPQGLGFHKEGIENSEWIILDYFDVVVHVFQTEFRESYKLEELWADAEITKIEVKYTSIEN